MLDVNEIEVIAQELNMTRSPGGDVLIQPTLPCALGGNNFHLRAVDDSPWTVSNMSSIYRVTK